jgi:hypothetical protein
MVNTGQGILEGRYGDERVFLRAVAALLQKTKFITQDF